MHCLFNKMRPEAAAVLLLLLVGCGSAVGAVANKQSSPASNRRLTGPSWQKPLCGAIGASYVTLPVSPQPTCRLYVTHQGVQRFADVYFPAGYSARSQVPLWLQLHGLYKATAPPASKATSARVDQWQGGLDHIKRAAEHVAGSWGSVIGWLGKQAILVYPDSTGALPGFQIWNSGFWQCPYKWDPKLCVDGGVDDVGFLETVTQTLLAKLPSKPTEVYALGFSNGGMILTTMLCKSEFFRSTLSAAALVSTVLKKDYLQTECSQQSLERSVKHKHASEYDSASDHQEQQRRVPLLFIQGLEDSLSPFFLGSTSAAGDVLLSTVDMADEWAAQYGCQGSRGSAPLAYLAGQGIACRDFCHNPTAGSTQDQASELWLCGMDNVGHDWLPLKADLAWTFYTQRQEYTAALPEPEYPVWQMPGPLAPAPTASPAPAAGPAVAPAQPAQAPVPLFQPPAQPPAAAPALPPAHAGQPSAVAPVVQQPAHQKPPAHALAPVQPAAQPPQPGALQQQQQQQPGNSRPGAPVATPTPAAARAVAAPAAVPAGAAGAAAGAAPAPAWAMANPSAPSQAQQPVEQPAGQAAPAATVPASTAGEASTAGKANLAAAASTAAPVPGAAPAQGRSKAAGKAEHKLHGQTATGLEAEP